MATAKTETLISLERAAALCGVHPLHFNQIMYSPDGRKQGCGEVWLQYDWQKPSPISRESFAQAIAQAEHDLEEYLGFPIAPKWYTTKIPIHGTPVVLPKAYFIEAGVPTSTKLGEFPVTAEDTDEDGFSELATVTLGSSIPANELQVYYPGLTSGWQIKPISVNGPVITLSRTQLVKRELLEALEPKTLAGVDEDFIDSVDVYRVQTDRSKNAIIYGPCSCGNGCQTCTLSSTTACMTVEEYKNSIVQLTPATWTVDKWVRSTCYNPQVTYAELNFKAGWQGSPIWDEAVVYLALSRLPEGLCQCEVVQKKVDWWATDTALSNRTVGSFKIPKFMEFCPWGYTRGAMYAYSVAYKYKMAQGL